MARRPRRGTQRRTRHRRMTTVSSTSSFCSRRRRRRLLGRQAAGRGTTFGAGCTARRAASAPSPPRRTTCTARARTQRHRSVAARARAGPTWESERISSVARALQGARRKGRAGRWHPERLSSDAPEAGRSGAEARAVATDPLDKFLHKSVYLLMLSAGPPEGGFVPKPPFHREHQDFFLQKI